MLPREPLMEHLQRVGLAHTGTAQPGGTPRGTHRSILQIVPRHQLVHDAIRRTLVNVRRIRHAYCQIHRLAVVAGGGCKTAMPASLESISRGQTVNKISSGKRINWSTNLVHCQ